MRLTSFPLNRSEEAKRETVRDKGTGNEATWRVNYKRHPALNRLMSLLKILMFSLREKKFDRKWMDDRVNNEIVKAIHLGLEGE